MSDEARLKLFYALTVDDVKEMKRVGLGHHVKRLIDSLDRLAVEWYRCGLMDGKTVAEVRMRLNQLRAATD